MLDERIAAEEEAEAEAEAETGGEDVPPSHVH
jgi:hypothetical protein